MKDETRITIEERMQDIRNITEEVCDIIEKKQYEDFKTRMLEEYQTRTGTQLIINTVVKNNGSHEGFVATHEGSGVAPNVYIVPLYKVFKAKGFEAAYEELVNIIESSKVSVPEMDLEFKTENLILQVIGSENNEVIIEESPYKVIEGTDLICIYKWVVSEDERGICSTRIKNEDLERFGLAGMSEDEMYSQALENTQRMFPGVVRDMMDILAESGCPAPVLEDIPEEDRMYVITNSKGINGATSIIYEDILKEMAVIIGGDYYIIPSSIHEVICISAKNRAAAPLKALVGNVNTDIVDDQDRLSNSVYLYEIEIGTIKVAA